MQHHMELFIAAYNKLDAEHCKVKSELAEVKKAQHGMKQNLAKMTESISYGLTLMESNGTNNGMDYIKSALSPNINGDKFFQFISPYFKKHGIVNLFKFLINTKCV